MSGEKKLAVSLLIVVLAISCGVIYLLESNGTNHGQKSLPEGFFYSESDGRYIKKGPYWHPPDDPDHFSVRHLSPYEGPNTSTYVTHDNIEIENLFIEVNNLEEPQTLTLNWSMYNHENRELWFTIEDNETSLTNADVVIDQENMSSVVGDGGTATGWSFTVTLDNFSSVTQAEAVETLDLRVSSWENSSYNVLYTRDNFDIPIHFINKDNSDWTVIDEDHFGGDTPQGWSVVGDANAYEGGTDFGGEISEDIYRSEPSSLRLYVYNDEGNYQMSEEEAFAGVQDSFDISGYNEAYLVMSVRSEYKKWATKNNVYGYTYPNWYIPVKFNGTSNSENVAGLYSITQDEWRKLVIPLVENNVRIEEIVTVDGELSKTEHYAWVDDTYVIAR